MTALRDLVCFASAAAAVMAPATLLAEPAANAGGAWQAGWKPPSRSSLGLQLESVQTGVPCAVTALVCDAADRTAHLRASAMVGRYWGLQLAYAESSRIPAGENRAQGMNFSVIGKAPLGASFDVFGKLGTTYGRPDTAVLGAGADPGFGFSYGAGFSYAFTPRLSATLEWDSNDFRFPGTGREPVRSTSLGLRYRY